MEYEHSDGKNFPEELINTIICGGSSPFYYKMVCRRPTVRPDRVRGGAVIPYGKRLPGGRLRLIPVPSLFRSGPPLPGFAGAGSPVCVPERPITGQR